MRGPARRHSSWLAHLNSFCMAAAMRQPWAKPNWVSTARAAVSPKFSTMLSHDPEVVKAYQEDPNVYAEKITARLGYEMLNKFESVLDVINKFKLPLLVQCGSEDALIKGAEEEIKEAFKMDDQTINIYDGLYHEVYNELEKDRKIVLKDLSNWLEKHV